MNTLFPLVVTALVTAAGYAAYTLNAPVVPVVLFVTAGLYITTKK